MGNSSMTGNRVGIIGCGNISSAYLKAAARLGVFTVAHVADLDEARAQAKAEEFGVARHGSVAGLLADESISTVINLTIPKVHADVSLQIIEAGKSVYSEKPLAVTREQGAGILAAAEKQGVRVGCAPDTFLGGGLQTCRKLIDDGVIGTPVAASAFMMSRGHEHWHPDPAFYYQQGGGPLFDMGPYYLTALVHLMGPLVSVMGSANTTHKTRVIRSQPKAGQVMQVETPTHVSANLRFASGALATMIMTFDVQASELPRIEIYGTKGTLSVPDPNTFGGPVRMKLTDDTDWQELPLSHGHTENSRGIGTADMMLAIQENRPHRANGYLAQHVLDAMQGILESSEQGQTIPMTSHCEQPDPLPADFLNHAQ